MFQAKHLLLLICIGSYSNAMQRELTVKSSRTLPSSSNPLDPYNCGYLDPMPRPNAELAKLAIDVAPEEVKHLVSYLSDELGHKTIKSNNSLLYGASGSGKSTLAQAIAIESGHPYSFVSTCFLGNETTRSASGNLYRIVDYALEQQQKPYIIILNDMDYLWQDEPIPTEARTLRHLLKHCEDDPAIYFIGIATTPIQLNSYLGAFFNFIKIPLPEQKAREKVIQYNMAHLISNATYQSSPTYIHSLSTQAEHFCFFYLERLVCDAFLNASIRATDDHISVTEADFEKAFQDLQKQGKEFGLLPLTLRDRLEQVPGVTAGCSAIKTLAAMISRPFKRS